MQEQVAVGRGGVSLFVANITALLANMLYYVLLTNRLGSTIAVGVVTSLSIMIWFLVVICVFAQPIVYVGSIPAPLAVLKFIPEFLAKNERNGAFKVFKAALVSSTLLGVFVVGILGSMPSIVIPFLGGQPVLSYFVQLSAIDILVISMGQVCLGSVIALGDTNVGGLYIIVWSIVRYGLAAILLWYFAIAGVLVGWICGDSVLLLLAMQKTLRRLSGETGVGSFSAGEWAHYSLYTLFAAIVGFVINQADRLITLSEQGLSRLAIYNVAMAGASVASYAPYALVTAFVPVVAALFAANRIEELHDIIRSYTRYVSLSVMPVSFGLAAIMEVPLRIFGLDYLNGILPAVIVSITTGLTSLGAVYAGALLALGKLRLYTVANVLGLVALLLVAWALTPFLGLNGPALGRASLLIIVTIVYGLAAIKFGIIEIDLKAYFASIGGSSIMALIVFELISSIHSFFFKIALLPAIVIVGTLIYIGALRVFRLFTVNDIDFLHDMLPNRLHILLPMIARIVGLKYDVQRK
jgi:O-antigen/teichoic acid export membrane protein